MKRSKNAFLTLFIVGLFYSPTQAQSVAETPQFNFPLEVGNVWVYSYYTPSSFDCQVRGCDYQRWEVVFIETTPEKGTCGMISATQVYLWPDQGLFELCMNDNRLIRYPASDQGWLILDGTEESEIFADFNKAEAEGWLTGFMGYGNIPLWKEFHNIHDGRYNQRTFVLLENGEKEMVQNGSGIFEHNFLNGSGFLSHGFYETSDYVDLTGSYLNGVLNGDTTFVIPTSIEHDPQFQDGPSLLSAYPNPFNPSTVIRWTMDVGRETKLAVYDLLGREVALLTLGVYSAGQHSVTFDASGLPSGMYVIVLETEAGRDVRKVTLVK
jgi:hypothetical protein